MRIADQRRRLPWVLILWAFLPLACFGQQVEIREFVRTGHLAMMRWPDFSDLRAPLQRFYEPSGFAPAWMSDGEPKPLALSLIEILRHAEEVGLSAEDYDASRWPDRLQLLKTSPDSMTIACFDVALTVSAMRYASALVVGRVNPRSIGYHMDLAPKSFDPESFLWNQVMTSSNLEQTFQSIEPTFATYRRTKQALARYIQLAQLDDGEQLPMVRKTIEPGQAYAGIPRLARLLRLVGDLSTDAAQYQNSQTYDDTLVDAVKSFQRRHGLEADGRLGVATIRQLNIPLQERVRQLQLALERWRWLPTSFPAPPIFINIADFRLRALDDSRKVVLDMRVVVGRSIRTQTPVFSAEMTHVIFRPYWNVPRSILLNEILPQVERDRSYLVRKNFEVTTRDGRVVARGDVSDEILKELLQGSLTVRQTPGPDNSLGLVKLVFPNDHDVYLHDTPATRLFARSRRDFSHGCIRVEKPAELAAWVLRNNPGWTMDRVQEAMQHGDDDVAVKLTERIPVFIVYGTAVVYEDNEVHFSEDIYRFDARLATAIAKGYPYPR